MIEPDNHFYRLEYQYGDYSCTIKFNGDIGGDELQANLKDFLKGCSWPQSTIDRIFNEGGTDGD